jgi:hypothetical protein
LPRTKEQNINNQNRKGDIMNTLKKCDGTQIAENKIIVVTLCNGKGEEVDRKYSKAYADLISPQGNVMTYKVSDRMFGFLSAQSKDGKIYDMGGIEDEPESCSVLSVGFGGAKIKQYQFEAEMTAANKTMAEMFGFDMEDEKAKYAHPWQIELRLEDLMEEED